VNKALRTQSHHDTAADDEDYGNDGGPVIWTKPPNDESAGIDA
jgi:hypothetical protein